jgi:predicted alpha/beta-hydrolase family hydrolase
MSENRQRQRQVGVRLTDAEYDTLTERASTAEMTLADYLRTSALECAEWADWLESHAAASEATP